MEQMERITHMEQILDEGNEAVSSLAEALEKYCAVQEKLGDLIAYYESEQWRRDYDDDNAGRIPREVKRGVLSEDSVYNLLAENTRLMDQLRVMMQRNKGD